MSAQSSINFAFQVMAQSLITRPLAEVLNTNFKAWPRWTLTCQTFSPISKSGMVIAYGSNRHQHLTALVLRKTQSGVIKCRPIHNARDDVLMLTWHHPLVSHQQTRESI